MTYCTQTEAAHLPEAVVAKVETTYFRHEASAAALRLAYAAVKRSRSAKAQLALDAAITAFDSDLERFVRARRIAERLMDQAERAARVAHDLDQLDLFAA